MTHDLSISKILVTTLTVSLSVLPALCINQNTSKNIHFYHSVLFRSSCIPLALFCRCFPCIVSVFTHSCYFLCCSLSLHLYLLSPSDSNTLLSSPPLLVCLLQSSGQQIPVVVESCIRFINLHGESIFML